MERLGELVTPRQDGALARVAGTLVAPAETFASISRRPTWALALSLLLASTLAVLLVATPRVDWDKQIRKRIARTGVEQSEEQMDKALARASALLRWAVPTQGVAFMGIGLLLLALLFWLGYKAFGSDLTFPQSFSVTAHAFLPQALAALLSLPLILRQARLEGMEALQSILKSNLGAFADVESHPVLGAFLSSFDVFSFWTLLLLVLGFSVAAKASRRRSAIFFAVLWLIFVAGKTGLAALAASVGTI